MAPKFDPGKNAPPDRANDVNDPVLKEMNRLVHRAETDRNKHRARIADCYRYTMPWRHQFDMGMVTPDLDIIFDGTTGWTYHDDVWEPGDGDGHVGADPGRKPPLRPERARHAGFAVRGRQAVAAREVRCWR